MQTRYAPALSGWPLRRRIFFLAWLSLVAGSRLGAQARTAFGGRRASLELGDAAANSPLEGFVGLFGKSHGRGRRLAQALRPFPEAAYLTDVYPQVEGHRFAGIIAAANRTLKVASRSSFTLHFDNDAQMQRHFESLGFARVQVFDPDRETTAAPKARGGAIVRVVRAETGTTA